MGQTSDFLARLLAVARHDEDVSWIATHLRDTPFMVYQAGDKTAPHFHSNSGREAMAYLTFISEYYDCLPEASLPALFIYLYSKAFLEIIILVGDSRLMGIHQRCFDASSSMHKTFFLCDACCAGREFQENRCRPTAQPCFRFPNQAFGT